MARERKQKHHERAFFGEFEHDKEITGLAGKGKQIPLNKHPSNEMYVWKNGSSVYGEE